MLKYLYYTFLFVVIFSCRLKTSVNSVKQNTAKDITKYNVFHIVYIAQNTKDTFKVFEQSLDAIFLEVVKPQENRNYYLTSIPTKSGEKYRNDKGYVFWKKGNNFFWLYKDSLMATGERVYD